MVSDNGDKMIDEGSPITPYANKKKQALWKLLDQITPDMLPCAFVACKDPWGNRDELTDHVWRPETDLYELGWLGMEDNED